MGSFALLFWNFSTYKLRITNQNILICISTKLRVEQQNNRGLNPGKDKNFFWKMRSSWILGSEWW